MRRKKYWASIVYSVLWLMFSLIFAIPWIAEISAYIPLWLAWTAVTGMALIPGLAMAFINVSLLFDKRPNPEHCEESLPLTIIVAAYNEESTIEGTLASVVDQGYGGKIDLIVANDGSTDGTKKVVRAFIKSNTNKEVTIRLSDAKQNVGKANALNRALKIAKYDYVITLDADSVLHKDALKRIVAVMDSRDETFAAVAGTILCKNSEETFMTKLQDWDYLLGISAVKRTQSMYKGTLVAQGAFSIYRKSVLNELGGWPDKIGEDIVLSWAMLSRGYYIDHSETAICWTNVPSTYKAFFKQRKRWSRGLIEAFRRYPNLLFRGEMYTFFVWYNLMFPYIDLSFITAFIPGILAALTIGFYLLAGKMTLYLLPITFIYSLIILRIQKKELKELGISLSDKNVSYFLYMLLYQFLMTPATLVGYMSELLKTKRVWR